MPKPALLAKLTANEGERDSLLAVIADLGIKNVSGEPGTEIYAAHFKVFVWYSRISDHS